MSGKYGDDGYGPPPSEEAARVSDEFLVWPRPRHDEDKPPETDTTQ